MACPSLSPAVSFKPSSSSVALIDALLPPMRGLALTSFYTITRPRATSCPPHLESNTGLGQCSRVGRSDAPSPEPVAVGAVSGSDRNLYLLVLPLIYHTWRHHMQLYTPTVVAESTWSIVRSFSFECRDARLIDFR